MSASLELQLGHHSIAGPRPVNEDFCGAVTPTGAEQDSKGALLAVADGLGGHANGRAAAEYTVRGLLADYYATPDTWSLIHSLNTVIDALNRWLVAQSARAGETAGMATTLSAIVLRGRRFTIAHVGDSRIYRLRGEKLERLTTDHVWPHPELDNVLSRAIGLDHHVTIDIFDGELRDNDRFALLTDGVWATLGESRIRETLLAESEPERAARMLVLAAQDAGAADNCTALLAHIESLPPDRLPDALARLQSLPLPPAMKPGQCIDGMDVLQLLHASRSTALYRVRDHLGQERTLKTLRAEGDAPEFIAALAHEQWLASRILDERFPQVIPHPPATYLYYLMSWHEGASLAQRLEQGQRFTAPEVAALGIELVKGLATLHRLAIIHRDIKPDNLHLGADGQLRILDLGVAASDGPIQEDPTAQTRTPGTPSYMAPELFAGHRAGVQSDLFAAGVTLYELLTRRYPYGEIEPFQKPRFGDPAPPTRYRADIPEWLESVILKAVAREPAKRFETAEEFLRALELGAHRPLAVPRSSPWMHRDPQLGLKLLAIASLVLNILLLYLLLAR